MKKILSTIVVGYGLLAMAGGVSAAPITIEFQDPNADTPVGGNFTTGGTCNGINISSTDLCTIDDALGLDYSKDGATVNVTAYNGDGVTSLIQDLAPDNSGLGVLSPGETNSDDQVQLSNNESIAFDFSTLVLLSGLDFNNGSDRNCSAGSSEGPCGTFDLFVDGSLFGSYNAVDDLLLGAIAGSMFEVVATGPLNGGFAIGSITINKVPEPGTLALLGIGLLGMGFSRRRNAA